MSFSSFRRRFSKSSDSSPQQPQQGQSPYHQNTTSSTRNDPSPNPNTENPFTTSEETLVNEPAANPATLSQDMLRPTALPRTDLDPENETTERWRFRLRDRKASAPASDVGEYARHTSVDDRSEFAKLIMETAGMTPEEVRVHLQTRENPHYRKVQPKDGYLMLTGAFARTM